MYLKLVEYRSCQLQKKARLDSPAENANSRHKNIYEVRGGWKGMYCSDVKEKAASVQQQSKITTKPTLLLMHKEKCQSTFLQNLAEK